MLEAQNAKLEAQLRDAASAAPASRRHDPASWLPAAPPRVQLAAHAGSVNCVALHPVFTTLASGGDDCAVRVWDWELGELERTLKAHTQAVRDVDFGGPRGGVLLASCGADLAVKLWDPADSYSNIKTLMGHEHAVTSVRFLPGGGGEGKTLLVSASADRTLRIWDAATGACVKTLQGHGDWVRCVCPSDDGRFVLSASSDRTARVWDLQSPDQGAAVMTLVGHENAINTCAFAPASAYQHLSSLAAGPSTADSPSSAAAAAAFVATGARDKTIKLWDAERAACIATLTGHDSWVSALAFHPGGRYLLSAGADKTLRFWDLTRKGHCVGILRGVHDGFITCLRWAPTTGKNRDKVDSPGSVARKGNRGDSMAHFRCVVATGGMDKKVKVFMN